MRAITTMLALLALAGCGLSVGDSHSAANADGGSDLAPAAHDSGTSRAPGDLATSSPSDLATAACDKLVATTVLGIDADGHHNAGLDCLSCHTGTGAAPHWYAAGTLYTTASGTAPVVGATVHITDAKGVEVKLITANNGNFWTATALTYPVQVKASLCPTTVMMPVAPSTGSCNTCHSSGNRVHLP
jgi:hypothetical protein